MATITLDIPDAMLPRVRDALCSTIPVPLGETPPTPTAALAKQVVIDWIKSTVRNHENFVARETALAAVVPPTDVTIT